MLLPSCPPGAAQPPSTELATPSVVPPGFTQKRGTPPVMSAIFQVVLPAHGCVESAAPRMTGGWALAAASGCFNGVLTLESPGAACSLPAMPSAICRAGYPLSPRLHRPVHRLPAQPGGFL